MVVIYAAGVGACALITSASALTAVVLHDMYSWASTKGKTINCLRIITHYLVCFLICHLADPLGHRQRTMSQHEYLQCQTKRGI